MSTAAKVASYVLQQRGSMSAMKLQKLVYYSQAWHLVWEDKVLFEDKIEAWANGPVVPALYQLHKGKFIVDSIDVEGADLDKSETSSIDAVLAHYALKSSFELSELTHREDPWLVARGDLAPGSRSNSEITLASLAEYYSGLVSFDYVEEA